MKIIVLDLIDYKDNDVIINGISETGFVSFKVRGIKKPNSAFVWLNNRLVVADVEYVENPRYRHQILKSAKMLDYPVKESTPGNLFGLSLANEAVFKMLQDEDKHLIFHDLEGYIKAIKDYKDPCLPALILLGKLMKVAGFELEVNKCIYCGNTHDIVAFSFSEGGFICRNCLRNDVILSLNPKQMKLVRYVINQKDFNNLPYDKVSKVDVKVLLQKFYEFIRDGVGANVTSIGTLINTDF